MNTILIADDEPDILDLLEAILRKENFDIVKVSNGAAALEKVKVKEFDLVILDIMMPGMDGICVLEALRAQEETRHLPVLILSAKGSFDDRIEGLRIGADDYLCKPFSTKELVLRVKNLIKRSKISKSSLKAGPFRLDSGSLRVFLHDKPVHLTAIEFKLLRILIEGADRLQKRDALLRDVWGYDEYVQTRTLDTHLKRLRDKLEEYGCFIVTVRGKGYRFDSHSKVHADIEGDLRTG